VRAAAGRAAAACAEASDGHGERAGRAAPLRDLPWQKVLKRHKWLGVVRRRSLRAPPSGFASRRPNPLPPPQPCLSLRRSSAPSGVRLPPSTGCPRHPFRVLAARVVALRAAGDRMIMPQWCRVDQSSWSFARRPRAGGPAGGFDLIGPGLPRASQGCGE
jgi:hypothetical protein